MQQCFDNDVMIEHLAECLRRTPPDLDDILGASCELYCIDPDEIEQHNAEQARRMYCYVAQRFARCPNIEVGSRVGMDVVEVGKAFRTVATRLSTNAVLRDDLDLLGIRIAERILLRKRLSRK